MEKGNHAHCFKQGAFGLIEIVDRIAPQCGLCQRQVARSFAQREHGVGSDEGNANETNIVGSGHRHLDRDANLARVECDSFRDKLRLRVARIVTERERARARLGKQAFARGKSGWVENAAL